jgi:cytochrome c peroxidase
MRSLLLSCSLLSALAACGSEAASNANDPLLPPRGLEKAELLTSPDNPLTAAKVELGKQLFFDNRLSGSGTMACASCHFADRAFTDGRAVSKKDDGAMNTRNSPTMFNVGYLDRLYWDGRAKSLEGNVLAAWKAQLAGRPDAAAQALAAVPAYQTAFQQAFGAPPGEDTIVKALSSFLRTLRSGDSPFDRFQAGDANAIGDDAKAGWALFQGKAGCVVCHTPPLFTDRVFHNVGIGMAAATPDVGAAGKSAFDDPQRTGQFKTPSLRDVAKTAPYFHDGSVPALAEAVALMAKGGLDNPHKDALMLPRNLEGAELAQLVAFLESLTGNVAFVPPDVPK